MHSRHVTLKRVCNVFRQVWMQNPEKKQHDDHQKIDRTEMCEEIMV